MKKILLTAITLIAATAASFAGTLRIVSATPNPFQTGLTVCFETDAGGRATIRLICVADGKAKDEVFVDKQGHGTHCAGIAAPASAPDGDYIVEVTFGEQVARAEVTKITP